MFIRLSEIMLDARRCQATVYSLLDVLAQQLGWAFAFVLFQSQRR